MVPFLKWWNTWELSVGTPMWWPQNCIRLEWRFGLDVTKLWYGTFLTVYCMQLSLRITYPFSKCFQILCIFAQVFKYFALFQHFFALLLKNHTHAFTFYNRPCIFVTVLGCCYLKVWSLLNTHIFKIMNNYAWTLITWWKEQFYIYFIKCYWIKNLFRKLTACMSTTWSAVLYLVCLFFFFLYAKLNTSVHLWILLATCFWNFFSVICIFLKFLELNDVFRASFKDISFLTIYRIYMKKKIELFKPLHFL